MKDTSKLRIVDGLPCTNTVHGPRSIVGRFVSFMYWDERTRHTRFTYCLIKRAIDNKLMLEEIYTPVGRDARIWNTELNGPWEFESIILSPNEQPKTHPISSGIRCIKTRSVSQPETLAQIILQCVHDLGHTGACHYNPTQVYLRN